MVTIESKALSEDGTQVLITLSNGEDFAIDASWATQYVPESYTATRVYTDADGNEITEEYTAYRDSSTSLLKHELDSLLSRAQAREDAKAANAAAAQALLDQL